MQGSDLLASLRQSGGSRPGCFTPRGTFGHVCGLLVATTRDARCHRYPKCPTARGPPPHRKNDLACNVDSVAAENPEANRGSDAWTDLSSGGRGRGPKHAPGPQHPWRCNQGKGAALQPHGHPEPGGERLSRNSPQRRSQPSVSPWARRLTSVGLRFPRLQNKTSEDIGSSANRAGPALGAPSAPPPRRSHKAHQHL